MVNINSIEFVTLMLWSVIYSTAADEWPPLNIYSFSPISPSETKELNGCITKKCNLDDGSPVNEQDQFLGIAVYADRYTDGNCYGGGFCSSGYMVTKGEIMNDSETDVVTAYQVDPPSAPASSFTASKTKLMFKIDAPSDDEYSVFEFIPGEAGGLATFSVKDTFVPVDGEYVETQVAIYNLGKPSIFFAIPSSSDMSIWPAAEAGTTTQKATVFEMITEGLRVSLFAQLLDVSPKTPFQPASGWNEGPNKHNHKYGFRKMFTRLVKQDGAGDGVLWQDQTDWKIYMTWLTDTGHETIEVDNPDSHYLVAAASDSGKNGYTGYITMGQNNAGDKVTPLPVFGRKVDMNGNLLQSHNYDASKEELNVYSYFTSASSLAWDADAGKFGWMLSRTMTRSGDGLNHQSCISIILDDDMNIDTIRGQTSSHSWNNFITTDVGGDSEFLAVDLGDNFPRGVHVHKISSDAKKSKLVYQFKTKHGTSATSPAGATYPEYTEISGNGVTFYQWSNDNAVYTEIAHPAAIKRTDGSNVVIFAGERPPLDNSMAVDNFNAPRNLGLVIVSDDLQTILSEGESSEGGFYNFGGGWSAQSNEGIVWLTDFSSGVSDESSMESAVRIKTAQLDDDMIMIFYEVWYPESYVRTDFMVINTSGNVIVSPTRMPFALRLSPTDEVEVDDGEIIFFGTDGEKLVRFHFEVVDASITPSPTQATAPPSPSPTLAPNAGAPTSSSIETLLALLSSILNIFQITG